MLEELKSISNKYRALREACEDHLARRAYTATLKVLEVLIEREYGNRDSGDPLIHGSKLVAAMKIGLPELNAWERKLEQRRQAMLEKDLNS